MSFLSTTAYEDDEEDGSEGNNDKEGSISSGQLGLLVLGTPRIALINIKLP